MFIVTNVFVMQGTNSHIVNESKPTGDLSNPIERTTSTLLVLLIF